MKVNGRAGLVPVPALAAAIMLLGLGCGGSSGSNAYPGGGSGGRGGAVGMGGSGHAQGGAGGTPVFGTGGAGAGGTAGPGGHSGTGGVAGSSGPGGSPGFGGAAPGCFLSIQPVAPNSFSIGAGPGVVMRVQGRALGTNATLTWTWVVTYSDGSGTQIPTKSIALDEAAPGTVVEFPVEKPGQYQIAASVTGDVRCSITTQVLTAVAATGLSFNFRTTTDQYPVQETAVKPSGDPVYLSLNPGTAVALTPVDDTYDLLLPSYVRITSPSTSFGIEGDTTRTPLSAVLLPYLNYDVLIVPDGPVAPLLLSLNPVSSWWKPIVDPGITLLAQMRDARDNPIQAARLLLKRGAVPSTLGISDDLGLMTLQARPGSLTALIVPPDGSGLPLATTTDSFDLTAAGLPALAMRWDDFATGTLAVRVMRPDGVTPVGGAQIWLSSPPGYFRAGVLSIGDALSLPAAGSVAASGTTGDDGQVTLPPYPAGSYTLTVVPPGSAAPAAVTTVAAAIAGGPTTRTITLASKVTLTGALGPLPGSAGALIRAVDTGTPATTVDAATPATGTAVSTQAANDGTFVLSVDPNRTYELFIQPITNGAGSLGRAVVKTSSGSAAKNLGTITLPAGQVYQGTVTVMGTSTPRPVADAFIQVYCAPSAIDCVDPAVSLAEATSRGDGSFSVILPQAAATVAPALPAR